MILKNITRTQMSAGGGPHGIKLNTKQLRPYLNALASDHLLSMRELFQAISMKGYRPRVSFYYKFHDGGRAKCHIMMLSPVLCKFVIRFLISISFISAEWFSLTQCLTFGPKVHKFHLMQMYMADVAEKFKEGLLPLTNQQTNIRFLFLPMRRASSYRVWVSRAQFE